MGKYYFINSHVFAVLASAFMLQEMVFLDFKTFIKEVIYKIITVTFLSFIVPFFLYINMEEGWQRLIILGIFSTFTTICIIYYIGLTPQEGKFIKDNIIKRYTNNTSIQYEYK